MVWRRRLTVSTLIAGVVPLALVSELSNLAVRCSRCGQVAARIRRRGRGGVNHYARCCSCDHEEWLGPHHLVQRVTEVDQDMARRLASSIGR